MITRNYQIVDNQGRLWKETLTRIKAAKMAQELFEKTEGRLTFKVIEKEVR